MNLHSLEQINAWKKEGTRETKRKANELRNGAFAAYLQQECIAKQLAMSFLKFPSAMVDTLLEDWARHMKSDHHAKEKARAQKVDESNAQAVFERQQRLEVKKQVYSLRHQIRQMKALLGNKNLS